MNSIDVLAVPNKLSSFGHYSHPIKIYEAIACGIPIVATRTKSTQWILRSYPSSLVTPGKLDEFVESLSAALTLDKINYDELPSWKDLADNLNQDLIQYI